MSGEAIGMASLRRNRMKTWGKLLGLAGLMAALATPSFAQTLLNASYDPTRELYTDFNAAFVKYWQAK